MKKQLLASILALGICVCTISTQAFAENNSQGIKIDATNFPDVTFRGLVEYFDNNSDDSLSEEEIQQVTSIYCNGQGISDLKGIEYFTALTELFCHDNVLSSLDVSKNTELSTLLLGSNKISSLDVSKNTLLEQLYCDSNQLTSLDVSNNTLLKELDCSGNQLTSLDVSNNKDLTKFYCFGTQISNLNLSNNQNLTGLVMDFNKRPIECIISDTGILGMFQDSYFDDVITDDTVLNGGKAELQLEGGPKKIVFTEGSDTISFSYNGYQHKLIKVGTNQNNPGQEDAKTETTDEVVITDSEGNIVKEPERWVPTTPDEIKRYAFLGKEAVNYNCPETNAYGIKIINAMQGPKCFVSFEAALGDYTMGRTYNVYVDNKLVYATDKKATITLSIPKELQKEGRTFKMICVTEGGLPIVLNDLDKNPETITFETDKFYAFALIYK